MSDDLPLLRLLDTVAWCGTDVSGERVQQLLAVLVQAAGRSVATAALAEAIWGVDEPANPAKAVQVLVSRLRALTGPEPVQRVGAGYRLSLRTAEVDVWVAREALEAARRAEAAGDLAAVRRAAEEVLAVAEPAADGDGPLGRLRASARDQRHQAVLLLGRAASRLSDHEVATEALTHAADAGVPLDEPTLTALLRSEAAVHGAPAALQRYERSRARLRDRLGVDPGPALQAVHAELLLADQPVRTGVRFDATSLVGRDEDLAALHASVATSRVTTLLGPGGLGKTRLAHALARGSSLPSVHVVELVPAATADEVVAEIGSALGVRGSVSGRTLTADQRTDLRTRIAHHLGRVPSLLVLDNCEHVIDSVAPLVAFLVTSVPELRVLTTSRARLGITAERVHSLRHLPADDAVELFCQRADAARPGVALDLDDVRRVVDRLDGLPLAIELAAAKVRVMAVPQIARLLSDRFALLTGEDRSAPQRHQTLLAVLDWSWNLLAAPERQSLSVLSVFADGFSLEAAETVLSAATAESRPHERVRALVDQSLLAVDESVDEAGGSLRFRMLETVREFGRWKLAETGDEQAARAAVWSWARGRARGFSARLLSPDQFEAVDQLAVEEGNFTEVLRSSVAARDPATVVDVLAALGSFWAIRGEHARIAALVDGIDAALIGWQPSAEHLGSALAAAALVLMSTVVQDDIEAGQLAACRRLFADHGSSAEAPWVRGLVGVLEVLQLAGGGADPLSLEAVQLARLLELTRSEDRAVAYRRCSGPAT